MHTKHFYFMKGWDYARTHTIQTWGECNSWQKKMFKVGYDASMRWLALEAKRKGFSSVSEYQIYLTNPSQGLWFKDN